MVLKRPSVVVATLTGLLLIEACAAVEASVTSVFGEGSPNAGIVLAVFAVGSLFGGLAFGHRPISPTPCGRAWRSSSSVSRSPWAARTSGGSASPS
ncbi:hypothetical protein QP157_07545 [Sphingomonas sp. LR61]|uniref:hypothetical protein n=1 Tax=Sphingomonas sp. LR61 TaxID=3050234 RepID=UPI002FE1D12A